MDEMNGKWVRVMVAGILMWVFISDAVLGESPTPHLPHSTYIFDAPPPTAYNIGTANNPYSGISGLHYASGYSGI